MKFRKKPVVIEAVQWTGSTADLSFIEAFTNDTSVYEEGPRGLCRLFIKTLEGNMTVSKYDWIIKGVKGECYPCKPDIFDETYEQVE